MRCLLVLCLFALLSLAASAAQGSGNGTGSWQTLGGHAPMVIANGGFSGLFPHSSELAYSYTNATSLQDAVVMCDVQLTEDYIGICFPSINLEKFSDVSRFFATKNRTYSINGVETAGYFPIDFTFYNLTNVSLIQGVLSRSDKFDGLYPILTVEYVLSQLIKSPQASWLNVQHDAFYAEHNLSMRNFVLSASKSFIINYISSPEVNFLKGIKARLPNNTKLIFSFLGQAEIEPSTNVTYASLLTNLTHIKTFASGILVPNTYLWPTDPKLYLQPHTSLVSLAHKEGLEVYASGFANDNLLSYNYSFDPVAEYLNFVDNGNFSVDGVVTDFPITASASVACFSHTGKNVSEKVNLQVISYNGASGDFAGCTDLAYSKAISDGVDILDCQVQMTEDAVPYCLGSTNLVENTNVLQSSFGKRVTKIPEVANGSGIYAFNLTWKETKSLTPMISNPFQLYNLSRNPLYRNAGKYYTLAEFLDIAKNSSVSGVLIGIEHAAYLAKAGLDIIGGALDELSKAGYNQTSKKVMVQSTDSSVLAKVKERSSTYKLVYEVDYDISDVHSSSIKKFADAVVIQKTSIFPVSDLFITGVTDVVDQLHSHNLSVYVKLFNNEFVSQAWDFFSDASVELNSFFMVSGMDGVVTDYPKTAVRYKSNNKCLGLGDATPPYMTAVQPAGLLQIIPSEMLPPAEAPNPTLTDANVSEPPLPPVSSISPPGGGGSSTPAAAPTPPNSQPRLSTCISFTYLLMLLSIFMPLLNA